MKNSINKNQKNMITIFGFTPRAMLATLLLVIAPLHSAKAEEVQSRYEMIESKNGIIRLDKKTGNLSSCKKSSEGWSCQPIKEHTHKDDTPDKSQDKDKLYSELRDLNEALQKENQRLKQKIADLEFGLNDKTTNKKFNLPSDEEVDEAITYMEKMIRKFGGAMKRLREKNSDAPETEL